MDQTSQNEPNSSSSLELRWREVYSLAALSAAVSISWIAYHEYQPQLLSNFGLGDLALFLILAKGIVLVLVPPIAGWLSDMLMRKTGRFFMIFSVGIGITAMVFMVIATLIGNGEISSVKKFLPVMIILWLIAMNIFTSPALSMIDSFAPTQKLPLVVGFLFFVTQIIYALEPVVVELVQFFGDTLTFVVGGVLIGVTGYIFHKVSSDEVVERRKQMMETKPVKSATNDMGIVLLVGLILGAGSAFLVEYIPVKAEIVFNTGSRFGPYLSFALLGFAALLAVLSGGYVARKGFLKVLWPGVIGLLVSLLILIFSSSPVMFVLGGILVAIFFAIVNVSALPYVISKFSVRNITFGVGMFIGASYIVEGILEYLYR